LKFGVKITGNTVWSGIWFAMMTSLKSCLVPSGTNRMTTSSEGADVRSYLIRVVAGIFEPNCRMVSELSASTKMKIFMSPLVARTKFGMTQ
jgi:hypothetical protein